jgi:elongation factor Ts
VPADVLDKERAIYRAQMEHSGKPANVIDKIVESGLRTFYKEVCLLDQGFIFDDKKSIAQALKEAEAKAGAPIKIAGFVRFALGEGIERPSGDFGGEVAALAGTH